jgi:histone H3
MPAVHDTMDMIDDHKNSGVTPVGEKKMRKKYKFKSGTVCLREIKKIQKTTKLLIQKSPFKRLVKEITSEYTPGIIYQKTALEALQEAAEDYIIEIFQNANKQAKYGNRKTITVGDVKMSK